MILSSFLFATSDYLNTTNVSVQCYMQKKALNLCLNLNTTNVSVQ